MNRAIAILLLLFFLSPLIQAMDKIQESNLISSSKYLPIFEGEMKGLGKVTLVANIHYEPVPYLFEESLFSSFTSLMIEHDVKLTNEEYLRQLKISAEPYNLVSTAKGFWGDWYNSLPLSSLQKENLTGLFEETKGIFEKEFGLYDCEFSQIHPFVFTELWFHKIHKEARTLKTFEETIEGKFLRGKLQHNKRLAFLESWDFSFEEMYGEKIKCYTYIMKPPEGCEKLSLEPILTLLEIMNHSIEEKVAEFRKGIAGYYQSLFTEEWKGTISKGLEKRDATFSDAIISEMEIMGEQSNILGTFGLFHTRGVLKRLQERGLSFTQLMDDGSKKPIELLID